ncbi:integrase [Escherichia coli EC1846]|uniref:Integrase n=1 Tax=Escherichia coli EC1870 TaxID=1005554 RepID=A0AAV3H6T1_ECOLX|nr:phage integrase family protein [Escherichia coli OK1180]EIN98914.1 integrase [Escherichia coli PA28]EIO56929.1 integrase [Escherichia coli TW10246]EIP31904.1 integrase [Escherichia coli EC4402]EIP43908.1 integrase [Escherichia coli EC4436]EIP52845.1 integrase [Escherichia coli EC4437]EKI68811.1 integrase [Escherichia coli EC1846]EKJ25137.1 integrase [Escherichia coli EC1866]EKJ40947.1 integrase [Escherichia coli EC1870]ELW18085.1 phage integrase family protein [Escherichia coli 99.1762]
MRITPAGTITFQYRYRWNGKPVRLTVGRYPSTSLKDARVIVGEMRALYMKGVNPKNYFAPSDGELTLKECLDQWWDKYVTDLKPNTQTLYRSVVYNTMYTQFEGSPVASIPVSAWARFFDKQESLNKKKARVLLLQLRSVINWCISRQLIPSCELLKLSVKNIGKKPDVGSRVLTYTELAKIWLALENSKVVTSNKVLHQLLLLWGARLSELRLATASEFNMEDLVWTTPKEHSKMGNIIRRPVFTQVKPYIERLLNAGFDVLFPGQEIDKPIDRSSANLYMKKLREKIDIPEWRTHDFRRSLVTNLSGEGIMPHVTEKMLGHELGGVMAVYNKHDWLSEQKDAYELYADKIFWHAKQLG